MDVFKVIILIFEFLGFALLLRRFTGLPLSIAPPVIVSMVVLLLYFSNFLVSLQPMSILFHIAGILAFLYFAWLEIKNRSKSSLSIRECKPFLFPFSVVLFIVLSFFFLDRPGEFHYWDEFSHWGTVIRAMYEANTFLLDPNPLYCQDYPPGTALFSYYILTLLRYSEGNAYFSFSLLLLCYLTPIICLAFKRGIVIGWLVFLLLVYLIIVLGNGWGSVLIDHILSLAMAGTIVSYFILQKKSRSLIFIPVMLAALVLYKHAGSSLAMIIGVICFVDWLILRCTTEQSIIPHPQLIRFTYKDILWLISLFLIPVIVSKSWNYYVSLSGLRQTWGDISLTKFFVNSLSCCTTPREIQVAGNFFATIFSLDTPYTEPASLGGYLGDALSRLNLFQFLFHSSILTVTKLILILSLLGISVSCFFSTVQRRLRFIILNIELTFGVIFYSGSLLLVYLYGFSDYEAKILTSLQRYHNVFLLAWSLILVYMMLELVEVLATETKRRIVQVVGIALSIGVLILVTVNIRSCIKQGSLITPELHQTVRVGLSKLKYKIVSTIQDGAWPVNPDRIEVRTFANKVKYHIPKKAKVYIAWYGSNGWEFWMTKYELLPRITNLDCFSLGPKLSPDDLYTYEFKTSLFKDYDYFIIGKGLQILLKNNGSIFKGVPLGIDQGLLKIDNTNEEFKLIYIPE